jgi:hypothetical protein
MNSTKKKLAIILFLLGMTMIYIGGFYAPTVMLPPIITGIGFFLIALVFLKDK